MPPTYGCKKCFYPPRLTNKWSGLLLCGRHRTLDFWCAVPVLQCIVLVRISVECVAGSALFLTMCVLRLAELGVVLSGRLPPCPTDCCVFCSCFCVCFRSVSAAVLQSVCWCQWRHGSGRRTVRRQFFPRNAEVTKCRCVHV